MPNNSSTERKPGIVLSVMYARNYGFITPQQEGREGEEIFFHSSACSEWKKLEPGDQVTFIEVMSEKGLRALKVQKVGG